MTKRTFKSTLMAGALGATLRTSAGAIALACSLTAAPAYAQQLYDFNIPAQNLGQALEDFGAQSGLQIATSGENTVNKQSGSVSGKLSAQDALDKLLAGTGLGYRFLNARTIVVEKGVGSLKRDEVGVRSSGIIEEVIVTAEKREQSLQEVPVAISAFNADMLKARGIDTPQDLQQVVPSLVIGEQFQGPAKVTLRGIGSENIFPGGDPGVPVHINGHYTQSTAYVLRDMLDVERVEVLRGPQGTLYGRNAVGGNINIITKRPTEEFEGLVNGTIGNYGKRNLQAVVSGPLSESLRGRLAISDDKRDGYVENVGLSGDDRDTSDYTSIRGSLLYTLTDDIELYLNAYYFDDKGNAGQRLLTDYPTGPLDGGPNYYTLNNAGTNPTLSDPFKVSNNTPSEQINKSKGASLDFSWDLDEIEFRSLSAYDKSSWENTIDSDASSVVNRQLNFVTPFETFTQEFQVLSKNTSALNWVLGLFYYDEESSYTFQALREQFADDVDGNGIVDQNDPRWLINGGIDVESSSLGIYGQGDYALTDQLELVAGLRYSKDEKTADDAGFSIGVEGQPLPPPLFLDFPSRDKEWSEATGKLGLNYNVNRDAMVYLSYSRGYKAGGFNLAQEKPYDPELVDSWEVGIKSQWMDNRVQVNMAAFYYDYQDKQDFQRFIDPATGTEPYWIINASAATSKGVEMEIQAYITDAFFMDLSVGYLDAEFDEFESIDDFRGGQNFILSGNKLPFSPDWTIHVGAQYDWILQGNLGTLSFRGDYTWVDEQYSNSFNRDASSGLNGKADFVPSYHIVNTRLQWESVGANWLAELYVRNLTDEVNLSNPFVAVEGTFGTYLAPRTYGLKLQYNFW